MRPAYTLFLITLCSMATLLAQPTCQTEPNQAIPDGSNTRQGNGGGGTSGNAGISSELVVTNATGTLGSGNELLTVCVLIEHTFAGDLVLQLTSPEGTVLTLSANNGGNGDNYGDLANNEPLCFTADPAAPSITSYMGEQSGEWQPEMPFSTLDGESPNGTWTLNVSDVITGESGTFISWSLVLANGDCQAIGECDPNFNIDIAIEGNSNTICAVAGSSLNINATPAPIDGETGILTTSEGETINDNGDGTGTYFIFSSGTDTITYTYTDINGCEYSESTVLYLYDAPQLGFVSTTIDGSCASNPPANTYSVQVFVDMSGYDALDAGQVNFYEISTIPDGGTPSQMDANSDTATVTISQIPIGTPWEITVTPEGGGDCGATLTGDSPTCPSTCQQMPNIAIPDGNATRQGNGGGGIGGNSGVSSELVIENTLGTLGSGNELIAVCVLIEHTFAGDLVLQLTSPTGTVLTLSANNGGNGDNYGDLANNEPLCFTADPTAPSITSYMGEQSGEWQPEMPFSTFDGESPGGTWTLNVSDVITGESGTFISWSLVLANGDCQAIGECDPNFNIDIAIEGNSNTICAVAGSSLNITATPAPIDGEIGILTTSEGETINDNGDGTGTYFIFSSGTDTLTYTYTDINGCEYSESTVLYLYDAPQLGFVSTTIDGSCASNPPANTYSVQVFVDMSGYDALDAGQVNFYEISTIPDGGTPSQMDANSDTATVTISQIPIGTPWEITVTPEGSEDCGATLTGDSPTCPSTCQQMPNVAIPDGEPSNTRQGNSSGNGNGNGAGNGVSSAIIIDNATGVLGMGNELTSICLLIEHTYIADLVIQLTSPIGTTITLAANNGGDTDNYGDVPNAEEVCFTMAFSQPSINDYTGGMTGDWLPEIGFDAFNGESPNGIWILTVEDEFFGDVGTLLSWSLSLANGECVCDPAGLDINISLENDQTVFCADDMRNSTITATPTPMPGESGVLTTSDPTLLTDNGDGTGTFTAISSGTHPIQYSYTDINGCNYNESVAVYVYDRPQLEIVDIVWDDTNPPQGSYTVRVAVDLSGYDAIDAGQVMAYSVSTIPDGGSPQQISADQDTVIISQILAGQSWEVLISDEASMICDAIINGGEPNNCNAHDLDLGADTVAVCHHPEASYTLDTQLPNMFSQFWTVDDGSPIADTQTIEVNRTGMYKVGVTDECGNTAVDSVYVLFDEECVWPGDVNLNGIVDFDDLLDWGGHVGLIGPTRPYATHPANDPFDWMGQGGVNWDGTQDNGANNKHLDCNGNGIVDLPDVFAIPTNFHETHAGNFSKQQNTKTRLRAAPVAVEDYNNDTENDTIFFDIFLEDTADVNATVNLHGIRFDVSYDFFEDGEGNVLDAESWFDDSWLGQQEQNMIGLYKNVAATKTLHVGMTRLEAGEIEGSGKLCQVGCIVDIDIFRIDTDQNQRLAADSESVPLTITLTNVRAVDENGEETPVADFTTTVQVVPVVNLELTALLQGAFNPMNGQMLTTLNNQNLLPETSPYTAAPWNYTPTTSTPTLTDPLPTTAVDWVLVEVRTATAPHTIVEQITALLLNDGTLMGLSGGGSLTTSIPLVNLVNGQDYQLILRHRNHLAIASTTVTATDFRLSVDLTDPTQVVGGTQQLADLGNGQYGLLAGDIDANGVINVQDFNAYQNGLQQASGTAYDYPSDLNLTGNLTVDDFNQYQPNASKIGISLVRYE